MKRWQKWVIGVLGVLVLLVGFVGLVLPGIVRSKAVQGIEAATGRKAAIARVAINPFTWTVRVEGFRLREKGSDAVFASFSSVRLNLSARSVFRLAPIVTEAHLASPYVHIVRTAANSYNFSDLLEGKGVKKEEAKKTVRFSLNNITIGNGAVDFDDRALAVEKRHTLRNVEVGVPFISNIPYLADRYVQPRFSALVNGAPFNLAGRLKPFVKGAETTLDVNLKELSLPFYLSYYPGTPPVQVDSGRLSTTLEIVYRIAEGGKPELEVKGRAVLDGIAVRDRHGAPLASLARGEVKIGRARVMARDFALASLDVRGLEAYLTRNRSGAWNFQQFTEGREAQPPATPASKPVISIDDIRFTNCQLHVVDGVPPGGFATNLTDISLGVRGFSTAAGKKGTYTLAFATARGEKGKIAGEVTLEPLAVTSTIELGAVPLASYYPYLAGVLNGPVKGAADLSGEIAYRDKMLSADKVTLGFKGLAASFGPKEGLLFNKATMEGGHYSQQENLLEFAAISVAGGNIRFSRDQKGNFSPITLLRKMPADKKGVARPQKSAGPTFRYRTRQFALRGLSITFTDRQVEGAPTFSLRRGELTIRNFAWPRRETMPFSLRAGYGTGGNVRLAGTVSLVPFALKGDVTLRKIALEDFDPYLPDNLNLTVADGNLDTKLSFALATTGGKMTGRFRGNLGVRSFYCLDAEGEDLLKWESLELDNLRGTLSPFSLDIADVALNRFYSRIVVEKDGVLNLKRLYTPEKGKEEVQQPAAADPPAPAAKPAPGSPPVPRARGTVRIATVTLQDGTIAFVDRHTSPEYASTMVNLGGRISGLSSAANTLADVDLRGNLENQSPLRITGRINPLRDDLFVDLKVSFNDIELSPITPYSGTFLGYAVDKGKLYLDLTYHIEKKELSSKNKVFIDQLTFGKKVESNKATSLPVRLAVALLKDRKGEIHLDLPVEGRIDDPKFSVFSVVLQMLKNLLVKAATSPFALLQGVFGGKEDFSSVHFGFGTAHVPDAEREKLRKLAQVIQDRPALKLEVTGFVDRERDPEGYRQELLLKKMKQEKFLVLVKEKKELGGGADSVTIQPDEQSRYLKAVYKKEKFPKPRNFLGLVKDLPDPEMKKLILANTVVGDAELKALARDRATAVRTVLVGEGKLPPERIFEKSGDIYKAPAKEGDPGSRVEFGVAVQ